MLVFWSGGRIWRLLRCRLVWGHPLGHRACHCHAQHVQLVSRCSACVAGVRPYHMGTLGLRLGAASTLLCPLSEDCECSVSGAQAPPWMPSHSSGMTRQSSCGFMAPVPCDLCLVVCDLRPCAVVQVPYLLPPEAAHVRASRGTAGVALLEMRGTHKGNHCCTVACVVLCFQGCGYTVQ